MCPLIYAALSLLELPLVYEHGSCDGSELVKIEAFYVTRFYS